MSWITPKTDWKITYDINGYYAGDFFNIEDYDRIKNNILEIYNIAKILFVYFDLKEMQEVTYETFGYAEIINALESNIKTISQKTNITKNMLPFKQWRENQPTPTFLDFNRIELNCLTLYTALNIHKNNLIKLPFTLKGSEF